MHACTSMCVRVQARVPPEGPRACARLVFAGVCVHSASMRARAHMCVRTCPCAAPARSPVRSGTPQTAPTLGEASTHGVPQAQGAGLGLCPDAGRAGGPEERVGALGSPRQCGRSCESGLGPLWEGRWAFSDWPACGAAGGPETPLSQVSGADRTLVKEKEKVPVSAPRRVAIAPPPLLGGPSRRWAAGPAPSPRTEIS